ncbi:MAG: D-2-hydroxyacid dehydrogenase [Bacteroidota bacterium]
MKIVVLDGHTLNPDDLSWSGFEKIGDIKVYPRTSPDQLIERSKEAQVLLINKIKLFQPEIEQLPHLNYIGLCATGHDNVDLKYARKRGITVTNIPAYGTASVAQHAFALLLELTNRVGLHNKSVHELEWVRSEDFSYFKAPLIELQNKVLGVLGYGAIGKEVAKIAEAFNMEVMVHSHHAQSSAHGKLVEFEELLEKVDVLSIHASSNERTNGMINKDVLAKMKASAIIINTSRGAIINDHDLAEALNTGGISAAGLDVLSQEPPPADHPLLTAKNCVITPHISWVSRESRQRLMNIAVDNLSGFLTGAQQNVIN